MMSRDSFVRTPNETVLHLKPINFVFCLCPDDANYVTEMVNTWRLKYKKKYLIECHVLYTLVSNFKRVFWLFSNTYNFPILNDKNFSVFYMFTTFLFVN